MKDSAFKSAVILTVFLSSVISADDPQYTVESEVKSGVCTVTLKKKEKAVKVFNGKELGVKSNDNCPFTELLSSSDGHFWISSGFTAGIDVISKIDSGTFKITKFDLTGLRLHSKEFALNPEKEKIAFSDYPLIFDVERANALLKKKFTLFIYDLKTKKKQAVATSVGKDFSPGWTDQKTLEYNNPKGDDRIQKAVP
ncbi:MAG TPA: hypothetical protein PK683_02045 [Leptospiraceae bacterium]|nr:hypothetical protein [Leptospiraceae bacterium]